MRGNLMSKWICMVSPMEVSTKSSLVVRTLTKTPVRGRGGGGGGQRVSEVGKQGRWRGRCEDAMHRALADMLATRNTSSPSSEKNKIVMKNVATRVMMPPEVVRVKNSAASSRCLGKASKSFSLCHHSGWGALLYAIPPRMKNKIDQSRGVVIFFSPNPRPTALLPNAWTRLHNSIPQCERRRVEKVWLPLHCSCSSWRPGFFSIVYHIGIVKIPEMRR